MQLRDIEYVIAVAQEKSFSKAAEKLFISQPALSQSIRRLEQELGISLFIRTTNSVRLSVAGELFVADGTVIHAMSNRLIKKMTDITNTEKGLVRLGVSSFYSAYHIANILPAFRAQYPDIQLEIIEDTSYNLERYVLDNTADISLVPFPLMHEGLDYEIIHHEQILFALPAESHLTARLTSSFTADLPFFDLSLAANEPFIFLKKKQRFAEMGMTLCKAAGFEPNIVLDSMNWDTVNAMIGKGLGVGFVPEIVAERYGAMIHAPIYCRMISSDTTRPYAAVFHKGTPPSPLVRNFIDVALAFLSPAPGQNGGRAK